MLGVLPGLIGMIQATEAIKIVTGMGELLVGRLLLYDALRLQFREIGLAARSRCPVCGDRPSIRELIAYDRVCDPASQEIDMTPEELHQWRASNHSHVLVDVREPVEHAAGVIDGAVLISLGQLMARAQEIPKDRPVVVYCQSGGRSARAVAALRTQGYDAHNLAGGIVAWRAHESPHLKR